MRYIIAVFILAMALPVLAQTAEIEALEAEAVELNHRIQKAKAAHNFKALELSDTMGRLGYAIAADTLDAEYVVLIMPDSLARETMLVLREWSNPREMSFKKTDDPNSIRLGSQTFQVVKKALEAAFPAAPTR